MPRLSQAGVGVEPVLGSPKDGMTILKCSHQKFYELLASGEIEIFLVGRSSKVVLASIYRYIERQLAASKEFKATAWHPGLVHRKTRGTEAAPARRARKG